MDQAFRGLLQEKRDAIATRWRDIALSTYSPEAARFMAKEKDAFSNPVGTTFSRVLDACLDGLIAGPGESDIDLPSLIGDVMRIRAVQSFTPTKAVGFLFSLKQVVREELDVQSGLEPDQIKALLEFESNVDGLVLLAFDAYLANRERVYEIKATELRNRSERVIQKLNERLYEKAKDRERGEGGGAQ